MKKKHSSPLSFLDFIKGLNIDALLSHVAPTSFICKQEYVFAAPNLSRSGEQNGFTEHRLNSYKGSAALL